MSSAGSGHALGGQETGHQVEVVAGGAHRHRQRPAADPDLQRLLDHQGVRSGRPGDSPSIRSTRRRVVTLPTPTTSRSVAQPVPAATSPQAGLESQSWTRSCSQVAAPGGWARSTSPRCSSAGGRCSTGSSPPAPVATTVVVVGPERPTQRRGAVHPRVTARRRPGRRPRCRAAAGGRGPLVALLAADLPFLTADTLDVLAVAGGRGRRRPARRRHRSRPAARRSLA